MPENSSQSGASEIEPAVTASGNGPGDSEAADGAAKGDTATDRAATIGRATDAAVAGAIAEAKRPGQRGPDKAPRKRRGFSVGPLVAVPPAPSVEAVRSPAVDLFPGVERESFDSAAAEKIVGGIVSQLSSGVGSLVYLLGMKWTKDEAIARTAEKAAQMSDEERKSLTSSGAYVWEKYIGRLEDPREVAFWVVLGGWLGLKVGGATLTLYQAGHAKKA